MHERYKLREAKFFLARMEESVEDREAFRYYLSAFLSAARSVLQYAFEESKRKNNRQWYEKTVAEYGVLSFFKDKRDANVHREDPVNPSRDITIAISEGVGVFSAVGEVFFNDEPVEMSRPKEEPPPPTPPENRSQITVRDYFNDWPGPEDIFKLSHRYIEELERFVQSGIEQRYISG